MKRDIKEEIAGKLTEIEEKEKIQILYAVESGSRAWYRRIVMEKFVNSNP